MSFLLAHIVAKTFVTVIERLCSMSFLKMFKRVLSCKYAFLRLIHTCPYILLCHLLIPKGRDM